jgi:hypothetical protein
MRAQQRRVGMIVGLVVALLTMWVMLGIAVVKSDDIGRAASSAQESGSSATADEDDE